MFQVEFVKEPKDIDEAVSQVVSFQKTKDWAFVILPNND
jgi:hypothetical protein